MVECDLGQITIWKEIQAEATIIFVEEVDEIFWRDDQQRKYCWITMQHFARKHFEQYRTSGAISGPPTGLVEMEL